MSTQRSSALQGIVGVFLALGIIGGISILGTGGLLSQSATRADDGAPALDAPQAELLAPAPEAELVEPPLAPEDAPQPLPAERVADVEAPAELVEAEIVEEAAAGQAPLDQDAPIIPERVDIQVEQVDLANDIVLPAREDLTRIFSILILSVGVGIAVMLGMIFVQRRS